MSAASKRPRRTIVAPIKHRDYVDADKALASSPNVRGLPVLERLRLNRLAAEDSVGAAAVGKKRGREDAAYAEKPSGAHSSAVLEDPATAHPAVSAPLPDVKRPRNGE